MLICLICIDIRFCYSLLAVEKLTSLKLCSHQAIEGALSVSFYVLCSSLVHSLLLRQFSQFHSASARPSKCLRHAARAVCRTSTNMYSTQCTSDRNVLLMCASDSVSRISVLNLTSPFECKCTVYIYIYHAFTIQQGASQHIANHETGSYQNSSKQCPTSPKTQ